MEAMSMEVATVGTAAGGVGEIITDGVDGLLVEPRNVEALAGAMARLQDNPDLRRRLAQAGRPTIINRFDSRIGARTLRERLENQRNRSYLLR
jgi:colanic acid/amylovoran biosynthesis glycosyltransferase